jgi:hypothetical protein
MAKVPPMPQGKYVESLIDLRASCPSDDPRGGGPARESVRGTAQNACRHLLLFRSHRDCVGGLDRAHPDQTALGLDDAQVSVVPLAVALGTSEPSQASASPPRMIKANGQDH